MLFLYHTAVHKVKGSQCYPAWQQHNSGCNEQILPKNADVMLHPTAKRRPQHPFPRVPFTKGHWEDAWSWQSSPAHGHLGLAAASRSKALWQDCHEDHECYIPKQLETKEQEDISKQCSDLLSTPVLTSRANTKKKKSKQLKSFILLTSLWRKIVTTEDQISEHSDMEFLHCFQCKEKQQLWCSLNHTSRYIRPEHPFLLLHQLF